jgi:DNA-binding NarL/FixJ family response regulator
VSQSVSSGSSTAPIQAAVRRKRILLIDDGEVVRAVLRTFLEEKGFRVCGEAGDGIEGVEQAKRLRPDLIVLDLAMPRMNGAEVASAINHDLPGIPIILFTMHEIGKSFASAPGITAVVSKTEGLNNLVRCMTASLGE